MTSQTRSNQTGEPSDFAIPAGVRKMPTAITSPTISAVALRSPICLLSFAWMIIEAVRPTNPRGIGRIGALAGLTTGLSGLERETYAQLDLATRGRRFRDSAKLRCVYEAVWRSQIRTVECIKGFSAKLKFYGFGY